MTRAVLNKFFCFTILLLCTFINVQGNNIFVSKNSTTTLNELTPTSNFQNQKCFSFIKRNSDKGNHNGNLVEIIEIQEIVEEYTPSNESDFTNISNQNSHHFNVLVKESKTLKKHKQPTLCKPTLRLHLLHQVFII